MTQTATKIRCELDGEFVHHVPSHLAARYGMTPEAYLQSHPGAPLYSDTILRIHQEKTKGIRREAAPHPEDLKVRVGNYTLPVCWDVPPEACLPLPDHYRLPSHGALGDDIQRVLRYWTKGRSTWIWGPPGSGKDAFPSALSAWTRTPAQIFPINPDINLMAWFYDKAFNTEGTCWEFGELFQALVHGYRSPISGRQIPMTIVLSDFDRANRQQAEAVRLIADSIQGRVKGPRGETYPLLAGTRIIFTANTMGGGDATGRCVSANVLDASLVNRIERKVQFHQLDWRDELPVLKNKFPIFTEKCSSHFSEIENAVTVLRKAVSDGNLYAEFSHRDLCTWIGDCEDILHTETNPTRLLQRAFASYADGLPDIETRNQALSLVQPHVKGGMFETGTSSRK